MKISEKYDKTGKYLNFVENLLLLVWRVNGSVSISASVSLVCVPAGIAKSAVGLNIWVIIPRIKKYQLIFKRKKKKHDKIVLLGKDKLNSIEVLISNTLIDSYVSHDEFVSVSKVLREYYEMKEGIKYPETFVVYIT